MLTKAAEVLETLSYFERAGYMIPYHFINFVFFCLFFCVTNCFAQEVPQQSRKSPPSAEAEANDQITEIIINASPLSDQTRDYAGSASVYHPLASINAVNIEISEIISQTPNFSWAGGSASPRFFQIRGIGELEQYEGAPNPSVGLIFDDLDLSGLGLPTTLFDIEQVEVLRGPQATRFGANALAGVVSLKSYQPTTYDSTNAQISLGNDNLFAGGIAFGSSVFQSKDFSFRLSLANQQSDGFRKNLFLDSNETNSRENSDSRLQLRYAPNSQTKIDLETILARQNNGYDAFALNNAFTTQSDRPGKDNHDLFGQKLSIEQELDSTLKVQSISSLSKSELEYGFDGDWGNNDFWAENAPYDYRSASLRDRDMFSQEFRLSSAEDQKNNWLLGVFGQHLKETSQIDEFQNEEIYDNLSTDYEADSFAGFAAIEEGITDTISVGSTIRVEHRSTSYLDSNQKNFDPSFDMQGGSAYIKYHASEDTQLYTLVSRGFKGGGVNAGTRVPDRLSEYDPESLWNYEIGIKGDILENKLTYEVSTFWMQRYDQQIKLALQDNPNDPLSFSYLTDNAGRGRNIGAESSIKAKLTEALEIEVGAGLLETKITSVDETLANLDGREQSSAPKWNYSAQAIYNITDTWYFRSSLSGQDSFYFDDSHDQQSDPYSILGAEIGWLKDSLRIALWGKNITNEDYAVRGFYFGNEPPDFQNELYIQRGDPTSFGLTLSYLF